MHHYDDDEYFSEDYEMAASICANYIICRGTIKPVSGDLKPLLCPLCIRLRRGVLTLDYASTCALCGSDNTACVLYPECLHFQCIKCVHQTAFMRCMICRQK